MKRWYVFATALILVAALSGPATARSTVAVDTLRNVRFGDHGSYERAVLDLGSATAPGDAVPRYTWARKHGGTLVRVQLPTVRGTRITDGSGLGRGISRYYVVRAKDGSHLFVDLHLARSAGSVNVFRLSDPARIVVDVSTDGSNSRPRAAFGEGTVVTRPRTGFAVGSGDFTVAGYGRPFEARGVWRLKNAAGEIVRRGSYETSDWSETWGKFAFTADYPAALGGQSGALEVGELSPRDGRFRGVSVPLHFR